MDFIIASLMIVISMSIFGGIIVLPFLLMYLLYRKVTKKDREERVHVDVDPADAEDDYVEGGPDDSEPNAAEPQPASEPARPQTQVTMAEMQNAGLKFDKKKTFSRYHYARKYFLMTPRERVFYKRLEVIFAGDCYIFPQVRLNDLLHTNQRNGSSSKYARWHVDRRSVDYVVCDRSFYVKLAIELDDCTHDTPERVERDLEVQRIFAEAGIRLMRCRNVQSLSDIELKREIQQAFRSYSNIGAPLVSG